jgi:hypothetical protein
LTDIEASLAQAAVAYGGYLAREMMWKYLAMRWVGEGSDLWRVRVDLFAEDDNGVRVTTAHHALQRQLTSDDEAGMPGEVAADQGIGIEGRPVVGLLFWVRADDVGLAARTAVETACRAGTDSGLGSELYDVVVIPSAAVANPNDPRYPRMPD